MNYSAKILAFILLATAATAAFASDGNDSTNAKNQDVAAILSEMGVDTKVDEEKLNNMYPTVNVSYDIANSHLIIDYSEDTSRTYWVFIYDDKGEGLFAMNNNIKTTDLKEGKYYYQLKSEGNTFAGGFEVK